VESEYNKDLETDGNIAYIHMVQSWKKGIFLFDGCWLSVAYPGYHMQSSSMLYHFVLINGYGLNVVWQLVSGFDHGMYSLWKSSHDWSLENKVIRVCSLSFDQPEKLTHQYWFSHTPLYTPFFSIFTHVSSDLSVVWHNSGLFKIVSSFRI